MAPTIGLFSMNMHACADPGNAVRIAQRAERVGYDSLWAADHVALPRPRTEDSPLDPGDRVLDPVVSLTYLAGCTERIRLGTGCVVLPQRNPVVLAKQLASVDVLSGGRLLFGASVGYLEPELNAVGVPMAGRGARADEYIQAISALWYEEKPAFHGEFADFDGVDAHPRPVQRPVPLVVGGHSAAAHRRAVTYGDEWFGYMVSLRGAVEQLSSLRDISARLGRQREPLRISISPSRPLDPNSVRRYADLGADRLVVVPPAHLTIDELEEFVEAHAPRRLGATERADAAE
ncbi:LLM class F420-dependent oxidoreductase [Streptomyces sp. KR55]|uniref:LLM class F420-dependent oxidoreductase n=1 Tax=Streptomyces sp. KR55 TaxID=3457425 RepID=UPI003FD33F3A